MNIQDYLVAIPYKITWHLLHILKMNPKIIFYCADPLDYIMFEPIQKHLPDIPVVVHNFKTAQYLKNRGITYSWIPSFPQAVIMFRHKPYKFPIKKIIKIGIDHGLYQFKKWTSAKYYNGFNVYFVSSEKQVSIAREKGITTTKAIGYPKMDPVFDGTYDENFQDRFKRKIGLDPKKKTLIFSSTWNIGGMSALDRWVDKVHTLTKGYNILITVHTWTAKKYLKKLKKIQGVFYISDQDVMPYLLIADLLIGDSSSLIGEFCALDRPIVTFRVPEGDRSIKEIRDMISDISIQIDHFEEIYSAIEKCLENPQEKSCNRKKVTAIMHSTLDGKAGERAAAGIREELKHLL